MFKPNFDCFFFSSSLSILFCPLEVRRKLNVKYYYNAAFKKIYVTTTNEAGAIENLYLAIPTSATVDLTATEPIFRALITAHAQEINDPASVQLIFAFVDPSTTIAYYKLTVGMLTLDPMKVKRKSNIPNNEPRNTIH